MFRDDVALRLLLIIWGNKKFLFLIILSMTEYFNVIDYWKLL